MKRAICIIILALFVPVVCLPVLAAGSTVTYDGGAEKFIFTPGGGTGPADLFGGFKGVMPGDVLTDSIEVRGVPAKGTKLTLYFRTDGILRETAPGFLEQIRLRVTGTAGEVFFDGTLDGAAGWIWLGDYTKGDLKYLNLALSVPIEMGNDFQDALGAVQWRFLAEVIPVETCPTTCPTTGPTSPCPTGGGKGGLPKTGDQAPLLPVSLVLITSGTGLLLLAVRRRKKAE